MRAPQGAGQGLGWGRWTHRAAAAVVFVWLALLLLPSGAGAAAFSDAGCPGPSEGSLPVFGDRREAETFTAVRTGGLTRATLEIDNNNQSADFVLQILPTDGNGVPVDSPLASATVPNASVPVGGVTLDVTFSPAAPVVAGHLYALAIARTGGLIFSYSPHFRNNNPCGGGSAFFSSGPGAAWAPETTPNIDFIFQTFVDPSLFKFGQGSVFSLVNKKGRLFAKVPGPGKLVVDDAKKPRRGILKHTKTRARKKGLVLLHIELTKRAIRRALRTRKLDGVGAVTYTPRGGAPSTLTFRIRLRL